MPRPKRKDTIDWDSAAGAVDTATLTSLVAGWVDFPQVRADVRLAAVKVGALDPLLAIRDAGEVCLSDYACHSQGRLESDCDDWAGWLSATLDAAIECYLEDADMRAKVAYETCVIIAGAMGQIDDSYGSAGDVFVEALELWLRAVGETEEDIDTVVAHLEDLAEAEKYGLFYAAWEHWEDGQPDEITTAVWERVRTVLQPSWLTVS
jgi:hypothetical protein